LTPLFRVWTDQDWCSNTRFNCSWASQFYWPILWPSDQLWSTLYFQSTWASLWLLGLKTDSRYHRPRWTRACLWITSSALNRDEHLLYRTETKFMVKQKW